MNNRIYHIKEDIAALYCLFKNGLIDATELKTMRDYIESLIYAQRPTMRRASSRMSSSLS